MTESKYIQGSGGGGGGKGGGGGGGGRTPKEADDDLASVQYGNVLDLISEGPIEGIEDDGTLPNAWQKNIYLDDTPLRNEDGSYNFSGFDLTIRKGTQDQGRLPDFVGNPEAPVLVNVQPI